MSYIKLHRKLLYSECFKKPEHLKLWIYCLLRANHEDKVITHGGKLVKVLRGSFITGRHKMSEDTGISERKIRTFLESKKSDQRFDHQSDQAVQWHNRLQLQRLSGSGDRDRPTV